VAGGDGEFGAGAGVVSVGGDVGAGFVPVSVVAVLLSLFEPLPQAAKLALKRVRTLICPAVFGSGAAGEVEFGFGKVSMVTIASLCLNLTRWLWELFKLTLSVSVSTEWGEIRYHL
jgi:hypothetical protein